jgi:hypothetical protein
MLMRLNIECCIFLSVIMLLFSVLEKRFLSTILDLSLHRLRARKLLSLGYIATITDPIRLGKVKFVPVLN